MADILFGDFETRSRIDLKKSGADVYARDRFTNTMCFGAAFDEEPVVVTEMGERPSQAVMDHVAKGKTFVAHNAPFEWVIWNHVLRREFPEVPELKREQMICTMAMSLNMALPGSLEQASAAAGIDMQKDMEGHRVMMQLSQPKDETKDGTPIFYDPWEITEKFDGPAKFKRLYTYCGTDVDVERALYKRLVKLSNSERKVWNLDHTINQRGITIDIKAVKAAVKIVELEKERLDKEMREITEGGVATCTANIQLLTWLNFKLQNIWLCVYGVAKNDVAQLLELDGKTLSVVVSETETKEVPINLPPEVRQALLIRQESAKSSNAKLAAMLLGVCEDGRARGLLQYYGAKATGRWAGRRIQFHNLPRPHLKQDQIEEVFKILGQVV